MAVIDGALLRVYVNGTAVAFATSSTINLTTEVDQIAPTSVSDAAFNVIKPRRKTGNIATNALYGSSASYDFGDLYDAWNNGTAVTVAYKSAGSSEWIVSSSAYVTSISSSAAVQQDASLRCTFQFSGATTVTTNP